MVEAVLLALALATSYLGCALFALGQRPHHAAVAASDARAALPAGARRRSRALGASSLAASFAASLTAEGPSFGSILWVLGLACAGASVMFTLSYRPHWLRVLQRLFGLDTPVSSGLGKKQLPDSLRRT